MLNSLIDPPDSWSDDWAPCPRCDRPVSDFSWSDDGHCEECSQEIMEASAPEEDSLGIEARMQDMLDGMDKMLKGALR